MQPYCGYSNHEVLDVISRRQLLSCPDQCPAKIYSLMLECWAETPEQRPSFQVSSYSLVLLLLLILNELILFEQVYLTLTHWHEITVNLYQFNKI